MSPISPISAAVFPSSSAPAVTQLAAPQPADNIDPAAFAAMVDGPQKATPAGSSSGNLLLEANKTLQATGGPSSPMALLAVQTELIQKEIYWTVVSQVTGKVTSGIQTVFTNQV